MALKQVVRAAVSVAAAGMITFFGLDLFSVKAQAQQDQDTDQALAQIGLTLMPAFAKITTQDPMLVGLGSFIVNGESDCNGCHNSDPANEYGAANNPYHLAPGNYPVNYNPATYLAGGRSFGAVGPGIVSDPKSPFFFAPGLGPNIISRNLTPDATGNPAGGRNLATFMDIMRSGHDYDTLHLNCSATVKDNCYLPPVDGSLLQVMPWPNGRHMTDHQIMAIWTYLTTIPCNAHNDTLGQQFPKLQQTCPTAPPSGGGGSGVTKAVANPKNVAVTGVQFSLDGTASTSFDGKPLTYLWTLSTGSLNAQIGSPTSATPLIYLENGPGAYSFTLTVTDDAGKTSTDTTTVWFY